MKTELSIDNLPGQLWPAERKYLHDLVLSVKPKTILEVGSGCGAGSTYAMASALRQTMSGILYGCEPDQTQITHAKHLFAPWPFVQLRNNKSSEFIQWVLDCNRIPDLIFFDGPEEPQVAVTDLTMLEAKIKNGTHFLMHDWDPEASSKAHLLRPRLESHPAWQKIHCLTSPESVGLCHYRFVGN